MKNYFKTLALVIALSMLVFFSKQIQDTLISEYNKSVAFMQKHANNSIAPLGV